MAYDFNAFLRNYIYIPLGGNRKGRLRVYANIFIVYLFSGLWHGANWTFILWGGVHGLACILDRLFGSWLENVHPALKWMATFYLHQHCMGLLQSRQYCVC